MYGTDGFPDGWWTKERITLAIQSYAAIYGQAPAADDWAPSRATRSGRPELAERWREDGCWPSHYTVIRKFGSWNNAIRAAGFKPRPVGRRPGGELPDRCARGHPWEDPPIYRTRKATEHRAAYTVRVCRECQREDHVTTYQRSRQRLGEP